MLLAHPLRPLLPHDVLRAIFEYIYYDDKRAALKLVLVSRVVQTWIELILYSVVNLHRETTSRAFLRTIETSRTKSRTFFATHVKSLCISYDIHNDRTARIISVCKGITSLTFWVVPNTWNPSAYLLQPAITAALGPLRPKKLSVLLHGVLGSPYPRFQLPFFEQISHLSVMNKWEDWTTWWGFEMLPCLTHLSFDLQVGPRALDKTTGRVISQLIENVLARCSQLQVCALFLIFDPSPTGTAATLLDSMTVPDPRLVFLKESDPFRDREAHSGREADIWKQAEHTVLRQNMGSGHVVCEI
ncbi:hypothetical protein BDZ94DRAFT_1250563 [Collybia nuda]|uniref:Uncharacterized protein n=1 Tax=Collybia nuda TaxID=64659 RepID=A0A9P6CLW0_9AGAR|nr:hypothetical protein BDZ94DRAFT_1250563 [Collybia nuda]